MRRDAARAERDRLARTVHDGVLQTLAYIHRRGQDLGGDAATLGAMAAEQERILRTLVSRADLDEVSRAVTGDADLRALLGHIEGDVIPSRRPRGTGPRAAARGRGALVAAVEAALDNVRESTRVPEHRHGCWSTTTVPMSG